MKHLILSICLVIGLADAADLTISGQSDKTYDGGTYGKCVVTSSHNITIKNCSFSTTANVVLIQSSSTGITVENCDIDGQNETCQAVYVKGGCSDVTIKNNEIYNIADDGICITGVSDINIIGNEIHHLIGKGTDALIDGPCYNGHSDGIEINNVTNVVIAGNFLYDIKSTSAMILVGWEGVNTNLQVYNNICYTPDVGFNIYVGNQRGCKIYNNTMWGASSGGISILSNNQNLEIKNNLLRSINFKHGGGSYDPTYHDFGYNLIALQGASQDYTIQSTEVWAVNPFFTDINYTMNRAIWPAIAEGFSLLTGSPAIDKGISGGTFPTTDYFGNPRDSQPDLGAIEFQGTGILQSAIEHMNRTAGVQKTFYTLEGKYLGDKMIETNLKPGMYLMRQGAGELRKIIIH